MTLPGIIRADAAYLPLDDHALVRQLSAMLDEAKMEFAVRSVARGVSAEKGWRNLRPRVRRVQVPQPSGRGTATRDLADGDDPSTSRTPPAQPDAPKVSSSRTGQS